MRMISRRDFLVGVPAGLAAAATLHPLRTFAADEERVYIPGEEGMIVRSARFFDLEMPPEFFNSWITPVPHFFVRNHMHEPSTLDADTWRLTVSGEVEKPLTLSLADLSRMTPHSVMNTLECAGNGRGFQQPRVPGVQWQKGAVGTARFTGPRLRDVLQRAGVKANGKHVMFHGLDEVPGKVPPFIRSISIEKASDGDTLIATHMNGAALSKHHGFPARALVPGWIGAASCKWLSEIKVLEKEFDGNFMKPGYRMPNHPVKPGEPLNLDDSHVVTALSVKSVIAAPVDGSTLKSRALHVRGAAWAGEADITKVEISTDEGATWQRAQLGREQARYAWRLWSYLWRASKPGEYTIMSRATDSRGRVQPATAEWNPSGYLYNAIDQVKIHVQA
ncbi:MAG TPA: molybdopterin-dependent oxidoreductase [Terriglobales bacterium]|nr:molybdopterin-dependent oxidoreductase [Terriglobales bacterium]